MRVLTRDGLCSRVTPCHVLSYASSLEEDSLSLGHSLSGASGSYSEAGGAGMGGMGGACSDAARYRAKQNKCNLG